MDPVERIIANALDQGRHRYVRDGDHGVDNLGLDFFLLDEGVFIECKQFHTPRTSEQMARVSNIIVVQGVGAAHAFARLITSPSRSSAIAEPPCGAGVNTTKSSDNEASGS